MSCARAVVMVMRCMCGCIGEVVSVCIGDEVVCVGVLVMRWHEWLYW